MAGDFEGCGELLERTIELTGGDVEVGRQGSGFNSLQVYTGQLGWQQMLIGNLERAGKLLAESRRIATAEGYAEDLVLNAFFETELLCALGDVETAKTRALECLEGAERVGHPAMRAAAHMHLGEVLIFAEEWDAAVAAQWRNPARGSIGPLK